MYFNKVHKTTYIKSKKIYLVEVSEKIHFVYRAISVKNTLKFVVGLRAHILHYYKMSADKCSVDLNMGSKVTKINKKLNFVI